MKRKLDTGHYTSSSAGKDEFCSQRTNADNQGFNSGGLSACHRCAIQTTAPSTSELSLHWLSVILGAFHTRNRSCWYADAWGESFPLFLSAHWPQVKLEQELICTRCSSAGPSCWCCLAWAGCETLYNGAMALHLTGKISVLFWNGNQRLFMASPLPDLIIRCGALGLKRTY